MSQGLKEASSQIKQNSTKRLQYSSCVYTSCYCEENVWKLCQQIKEENEDDLKEYFAVFISNKNRQIPLWMQKQGKDPLTPVVWDYHVILIQKSAEGKPLVYDLDAVMPFPCLLEHYLIQAIQKENTLKKEYHRKFRIIEAREFLSTFASDRSHMLLPNGQYLKPPPDYPPIRTADEVMNLEDFIDMTNGLASIGRLRDMNGFAKFCGLPPNFP